ncbi:AEC family transporter [Gammaproteobacteria bacterium AS21]
MIVIASALIPIIFTILLGFAVKRSAMLANDFWLGAESLTYYVLTPALLVSILATRPLGNLPWFSFLSALLAVVIICAILLSLWQYFSKAHSPAKFTSLFQGGVRYNTFIALTLVSVLYGDEGLGYGALAATGMIILINILCVSAFAININSNSFSLLAIVKQIIKNPWILGASVGIALNISGIGLHPILTESLDLVGRAAFPIGLILVGAGLSFQGLFHYWKITVASMAIQFIFKPICALLFIHLFAIEPIPAMVILIFLSVPTAPASYILARKLGGDAPAMATIITSQTLIAFISLPITLYIGALYITA